MILEPSLLTFEAKWRKLKMDIYLEEELEEEMGRVLCYCMEERARCYGLDDIIRLLVSVDLRFGLATLLGDG